MCPKVAVRPLAVTVRARSKTQTSIPPGIRTDSVYAERGHSSLTLLPRWAPLESFESNLLAVSAHSLQLLLFSYRKLVACRTAERSGTHHLFRFAEPIPRTGKEHPPGLLHHRHQLRRELPVAPCLCLLTIGINAVVDVDVYCAVLVPFYLPVSSPTGNEGSDLYRRFVSLVFREGWRARVKLPGSTLHDSCRRRLDIHLPLVKFCP